MITPLQAIVTKYRAPTSTRGAFIRATACGGKTLSLPWDHVGGPTDNHRAAALALAESLGWGTQWTPGGLNARGDLVWVHVPAASTPRGWGSVDTSTEVSS